MARIRLKLIAALAILCAGGPARAGAYEDFFRALERDDARTVTALLQRGFDPNTRDERGQVPLFLALRGPSLAVAEALWAHPALELDARNTAAETPLMMAALRGHVDWVRRLLERGARVHHEGWAPIHYAATSPTPQASAIVRLLLDRGAPVDAPSPNGSTPLMMAARYGQEATVDLLLERGADPRLRNQRGANAADFARMDGRDRLAERLERHPR